MLDDSYVMLVKKLADENSPEIINNSSTDHAAVLIGEMFRRGTGKACLFTGNLHPGLYARDEIVEAIGGFVSCDQNSLNILVQEPVSTSSFSRETEGSLANRIGERFGLEIAGRIQIKVANTNETKGIKYHFASVGGKSFRFEQDKSKHEAFASFNRPELAGRLEQLFDSLWTQENVLVH